MKAGIDVGSTTIKAVVLNNYGDVVYESYERHYCRITEKTSEVLKKIIKKFPRERFMEISISGSAAMKMAEICKIPFVQEVYATRIAATHCECDIDVIIELGGEDAKILFLNDGMEVRMNGSCAGGTGSFIDQMATLLNMSPEEMNEEAKDYNKIYTIASRCGVFAKSDIQPLLNQGVIKSDLSASIFFAVVNQTIAGLAQGRMIKGNVLYLGGPLTFNSELRKAFDTTLKLKGVCPSKALYYVALGAAYYASEEIDINKVINILDNYKVEDNYTMAPPLFKNQVEYEEFKERHEKNKINCDGDIDINYPVTLGIDSGSTTIKIVAINEKKEIVSSLYKPNSGNAVEVVKAYLTDLYAKYPGLKIDGAAVTGYGETLIKNAFQIDYGIVETVAHFTAAKYFMPSVDFIIDIGGQDIKCFKIHNGAIDNIFLNEACSSGCGSFLQTFANALGYSMVEFSRLGLFSKNPVDLGSRCTVFMNSSVKQVQKDGATMEDISAGLSVSVVKNALYKVIRASSTESLGKNIVVQGGTFLNDAVLRAFEQELKVDVLRPTISGLMGAYGAALFAKSKGQKQSSIIKEKELKEFHQNVKVMNCGLCSNHCRLTVNEFGINRRYIGGNRCERPTNKKENKKSLNIYEYKRELLDSYVGAPGNRGRIGIPMGLNIYELYPFWYKFFTALKFQVERSDISSRELYLNGQNTIPSDTVCFPAKLVHGHVQSLIDKGIETIFYPCMTYNIKEESCENCYNCPVVAYYPEVIEGNMADISKVTYIYDYVGIHRPKDLPVKLHEMLSKYFKDISLSQVKKATKLAYEEYDKYLALIKVKGNEIIAEAEKENRDIIVLAGRPYHIDSEINHGIDKLISSYGAAIISEDVICDRVPKVKLNVLDQWTYHSRLYKAAQYITEKPNMNLVQLVSFGCGVDAITTDEVRDILEESNKIYTQIKIDEITNLGAVKIRLRSLFSAIHQEGDDHCNE
ncbi:acyl-CoA dehydratase activase-related protein [Clostridium sp.]|uniref:acyl-CoA dehydratase activase-related protein n=1 Tax=Clostridium sp. TaxID=1506 RepID=UPI0032171EE9